jgi:hypothetical protein
LELVGPGPAEFYRDACCLIEEVEPGVTSTSHLVSHLLREVESALRDVLQTISGSGTPKKSGRKDPERHATEIRAILSGLGIAESDPLAKAWLALAKQETGLARKAHRDALAPARRPDAEFRAYFNNLQAILDSILARAEVMYLKYMPILDSILAHDTPTSDDLRQLSGHIPNNLVLRRYFFEKLASYQWLRPLSEEAFFKHPPAVEPNEETGMVSLAPWPESRYLARMTTVPEAQPAIIEIALSIPETDNARVHDDLVEIALALPPKLSAHLVPRMEPWIKGPYHLLLPHKIGDLIQHLLRGGEAEAGLTLLRAATAVRTGRNDEPIGYLNDWDYEQLLARPMVELLIRVGPQGIDVLADALEAAVGADSTLDSSKSDEDYSYIWRPAIENHAQNHDRGMRDALIDALRDTAEGTARREPPTLLPMVQGFLKRPWRVFRRMALHLVRRLPETSNDLLVSLLTDLGNFEDLGCRHEYYLLAKECFGRLSPPEQEKILGWIEKGPDTDRYRERVSKSAGREPTESEVEDYRRTCQRERLEPLASSLPASWKRRYEELASSTEPPSHPDLPFSSSVSWVGPTSPKTADQIEELPVKDLVDYFASWQPPSGWFQHSREGLGRALSEAVKRTPDHYAASATAFTRLDPTYVRALITGIHDGIKDGRRLPEWDPLLELSEWVLAQPRALPGRTEGPDTDEDPHWGWTRKEIARLLDMVLRKDEFAPPFSARTRVWGILDALTKDPDPTPEDEARYGGSNMDPATHAINTVRGETMHAVVQYALWVRRHLDRAAGTRKSTASSFDMMSEVKAVLEEHLDQGQDPSIAVRSIYGQYFPSLVLLDPAWSQRNAGKIFPSDDQSSDYFWAAWSAYVSFCPAYNNVLEILRKKYLLACTQVATKREGLVAERSPGRLAEHLVVYYWRGLIDYDDELLNAFFENAPDAVREDAMSFVGRSAKATQDPIEQKVLDRLKALWERRYEASETNPGNHVEELSSFAWWFSSGKFDIDWSLPQLSNVLRRVRKIVPEHFALESLARAAAERPLEAVRALSLIVETERLGWRVVTSQDDFRTILTAALHSGNSEAVQEATDLINKLGRQGFLDYRDLLP